VRQCHAVEQSAVDAEQLVGDLRFGHGSDAVSGLNDRLGVGVRQEASTAATLFNQVCDVLEEEGQFHDALHLLCCVATTRKATVHELVNVGLSVDAVHDPAGANSSSGFDSDVRGNVTGACWCCLGGVVVADAAGKDAGCSEELFEHGVVCGCAALISTGGCGEGRTLDRCEC